MLRSFKFPAILSVYVCVSVRVLVVDNNMLNIKINTSRVKVIALSARLRRSSFAQRHDHNEHSADVDAAAADDDHDHDDR